MILVDTSIWVDHVRAGDARLINLLEAGQVLVHPLVIGELVCGNLRNRTETLACWALCRVLRWPRTGKTCTSSSNTP